MRKEIKSRVLGIVTMAIFVLSLFVAGGCVSSKKGSVVANNVTVKELKNLPVVKNSIAHLSSKVKLSANIGGKEFSANGSIKIKRGKGLLISINALGGLIEVARVEMTPEKMLLIYRIGREYAEVRYSDVEALDKLGLNYSILESILLNELFTPDGTSVEKYLSKMNVAVANGEIILSVEGKQDMRYSFRIEQSSGCLQLTQGNYGDKINVNCNYSDFFETEIRSFPRQIGFSVANSALNLKLSNIKTDDFKLSGTTELSSYKKVDISTILKGVKF